MMRIAAVTMVRNDEFYLKKWVEYYGSQLGKENLYIYFDGEDQLIPSFCEGAHAEIKPRMLGQVVKTEKLRLQFLSERAAELMQQGYDWVIGSDADEYLIVDPKTGMGLREYISQMKKRAVVSGFGVDVGQHLKKEGVVTADKPFLAQRKYAYLCSRYTKTSLISQPVRWGSGFHRVKGHNFHIDPNLYLFHFGSIDLKMIERRMTNNDLISTGRLRHIKKRARTIFVISSARILRWDRVVPFVRFIQSFVRPIYALNKPWNTLYKYVVEIPDRFSTIV